MLLLSNFADVPVGGARVAAVGAGLTGSQYSVENGSMQE
jgi:hypothetical protein